MSLITKSFGEDKEYMIDQGGMTHLEAEERAKTLRKQGTRVRIAPYEGQWATWVRVVVRTGCVEEKGIGMGSYDSGYMGGSRDSAF